MAIVFRICAELYWASRQSSQRVTSAGKFLSQTNQQKWLYTGHLYSYIYSSVLIVASIYATLSCEVPNDQGTGVVDG